MRTVFQSKARGKLSASRNRMQWYQRFIDTVYHVTYRIALHKGIFPKSAAFEITKRFSVFIETQRKFGDLTLTLK